MAATFRLDQRPRPIRLFAATLGGSIVGTVALLATVVSVDETYWDMMRAVLGAQTLLAAVLSTYLLVFLGGVLPTLLIGAVLIAFKKGSALRLVLAPAILFLLVLAELARETKDTHLPTLLLPAIVTGGATMLWILAKQKYKPAPVDAVFE